MSENRIGNPGLEEALFATVSGKDPEASAKLLRALADAAGQGNALWIVGEPHGDEVTFTVTQGRTGRVWCCFTGEQHIQAFGRNISCYALPAAEIFRLVGEDGIDGIAFNPDCEKGIEIAAELIRKAVR